MMMMKKEMTDDDDDLRSRNEKLLNLFLVCFPPLNIKIKFGIWKMKCGRF